MLLNILSNDVPQTMCNLKFMKTYIINLFTHLNNSIQSELLYYIYTQLQKAHYSYSSHKNTITFVTCRIQNLHLMSN